MRCSACQNYIPEGLAAPVRCPLCGALAVASTSKQASAEPPPEKAVAEPSPPSHAFAPYFTVRTRLEINDAATGSIGSISFGPEGFSVVAGEGRSWIKILYRELENASIEDDSVVFSLRSGSPSRMRLLGGEGETRFSTSLWDRILGKLTGAPYRRAAAFVELLSRVKEGLSPIEISTYQRRLQ